MREHWDKAISEIDEKFISEAAQAHAKHAEKQQIQEQYDLEASRPLEIKPASEPKKSRKGMIVGLSAAAAAVVAVGIGGGIMLSRNNDALLPTDTSTIEATVEADQPTAEADDIMTDVDGIIVFSQIYQEGSLTFQKPEIYHTTGADVSIASSLEFIETNEEVFEYIESFSGVRADIVHENLLDNGYTLDREKSHYNGVVDNYMGEDIGHQVSTIYRKGDAEIVVNYGETGQNYRVLKLPGDFGGKLWAGEKLSGMLRNYDNNGSSEVYCGGMVVDGVAYYAVTTYWYNEETDIRGTCVISAMGCEISDITDILAGVICRSDMLHPVDVQPLNISDYDHIECLYGDNAMELTDSMTAELEKIMSGVSSTQAVYDLDGIDYVTSPYLHLYEEDSNGSDDFFRIHQCNGKYYYSLQQGEFDSKAYFEISEEIYDELMNWLGNYAPYSFLGTVLAQDDVGNTTDPDSGRYLIDDNEGGLYMIHSDERFAIGDTVRVYFYGNVMETDPAQIMTYKMEAEAGFGYIDFERASNSFDGMCIAIGYFFGKWGNDDGVLKIGVYDSPFTYADPMVGCYEDENGYFMLGENRAWYVDKNDRETLYYYEGVTDGQHIDTVTCTAVYQCLVHAENDGVYRGNGEMGYLGLLDLCYSLNSSKEGEMQIFDVSDFFDMEITDENGTRWVRTADRSVDWGGVYEIYINGERAHCLKMQNADDPSEFRYFSFFFSVSDGASIWEEQGAFRTESEESVLTWTDEHYCFDLSVCNTKELATEFAEQSENDATQHGHGYFIVEPYFYPCSDGSYYAERIMGNNQAQWLSDTEIFYNDGSGYQLVSDGFNGTDTHSIGDKLYVVHNTEKGISLSIYSGTELIDSMEIADDGQIVQMGTWAEAYGNFFVIEYYDSTKMRNVYAVVNGISAALSVEYYDSLRFNDDGTVMIPEG